MFIGSGPPLSLLASMTGWLWWWQWCWCGDSDGDDGDGDDESIGRYCWLSMAAGDFWGAVSGSDHSNPLELHVAIWFSDEKTEIHIKDMTLAKNGIQILLPPLFNCDLGFAICKMRVTVPILKDGCED